MFLDCSCPSKPYPREGKRKLACSPRLFIESLSRLVPKNTENSDQMKEDTIEMEPQSSSPSSEDETGIDDLTEILSLIQSENLLTLGQEQIVSKFELI